ncbi:unnamed protein product [Lathyrus sativus]|nr:unnamed protein product [Lathyrus sativus]
MLLHAYGITRRSPKSTFNHSIGNLLFWLFIAILLCQPMAHNYGLLMLLTQSALQLCEDLSVVLRRIVTRRMMNRR